MIPERHLNASYAAAALPSRYLAAIGFRCLQDIGDAATQAPLSPFSILMMVMRAGVPEEYGDADVMGDVAPNDPSRSHGRAGCEDVRAELPAGVAKVAEPVPMKTALRSWEHLPWEGGFFQVCLIQRASCWSQRRDSISMSAYDLKRLLHGQSRVQYMRLCISAASPAACSQGLGWPSVAELGPRGVLVRPATPALRSQGFAGAALPADSS